MRVHSGVVIDEALLEERTTGRELHAAPRLKGARDISQLEVAVPEVSGGKSLILNDRKPSSSDLIDELFAPGSPTSTSGTLGNI